MNKELCFTLIGLFCISAEAKKKSFQEAISVVVNATGDLISSYEFEGVLGDRLEAEASDQGLKTLECRAAFLFRKVVLSANLNATPAIIKENQVVIEVWPRLNCLVEGQSRTYNFHKHNLEMVDKKQKISFRNVDQNLKKITFEFSDLSIQKGK